MSAPRFATLDDWLNWQETLHPRAVELGLERVRAVQRRLRPEPPPHIVITVGGTNGKGSCVALLDASRPANRGGAIHRGAAGEALHVHPAGRRVSPVLLDEGRHRRLHRRHRRGRRRHERRGRRVRGAFLVRW